MPRPEVPLRRGSATGCRYVVLCRRGHVQKLKTTGTHSSSIRNLPIVTNLGSTMVYGYPYRDEKGFLNFGGSKLSSLTVIGYTKMGSK